MHMHTARLLKSSCSLTELDLGSCDLGGAADVTRLLEALKDNTIVTELTLSGDYRGTVTSAAVYTAASNLKTELNFGSSSKLAKYYCIILALSHFLC